MILDGGAIRGCFMGGVLAEFHRQGYDAPYWDRYIGTSIGATSATYFATGQIEQGLRFFTKHMPGKFTSNFLGVPYFDQHYLEHAYRDSEDALDVAALRECRQEVWMTQSCPRALKPLFVHLNKAKDPVKEMLRGTHTPITTPFHQKGVELFDGGFTCQPPVNHDLLRDAREIWFLTAHPHGKRNGIWKKRLYRALGTLLEVAKPGVGKLLMNMCELEDKAHETMENMPGVKIVRPETPLQMDWRCKSIPRIRLAIEHGREAARNAIQEHMNQRLKEKAV